VSAARLPWAIAGALGLAMLGAGGLAVLRAPQPDAALATALPLAPPIPTGPAPPPVGLIVTGLGGTAAETRAAIGLPAAVGLAFSPYAADVARWMAAAAADGHEVYLELPLEATDADRVDQGPLALGPAMDAASNGRRLDAVLALPGAPPVGVVAAAGAFARAPEAFTPVATALAARGLVLVELGGRALEPIAATVGLRYRSAVGPLEADLTPEAIEAGLAALATAAQDQGSGLGFVAAFPVTVERVAGWVTRLEALGLALQPPSRTDLDGASARASG
jgi:polysaccharide deacetylase 2 family uncharacterized protein YibQ